MVVEKGRENNMTMSAVLPDHSAKECLMTIFPGSAEQRGDRLRATLRAISDRFEKCTIIFADALDFWNGMIRHDNTDKAAAFAQERGTEWQRAYGKDVLSILGDRACLVPWDRVKEDERFAPALAAMIHLNETSGPVRDRYQSFAGMHADRLKNRGVQVAVDRETLIRYCTAYQMEEYAGLSVIRQWTDAPEVYPGFCIDDPAFFERHRKEGMPCLMIPEVIRPEFGELRKIA
jgi:hypothetical protein